MLAKAPLLFPVGNPSSTTSSRRWTLQLGSRSAKSVVVGVRSGYSRKPMETPGAYELIHDDTGDKIIVWGGIDDQQHQTPNGDPSSCNPGAAPGIPTAPVAKSVARFGNLKAKAVKAIVRRKTSRMKQEIALKDEHVAEDHQSTLISASILNSMRKKMITNAPTRLRDFRETTDNYAATARHGDNRAVPPPTTTYKPHEPDAPRDGSQLSHSKPANSNLRRWGNSRSIRHHESDSTLQHLRFHKLSADNGFFSKKTFRELGCSEHVIESLKAQNFLRPSHIQAMAFVPAIEGKSCIIADQSGSGKTLAYLLPMILRLRQEELQGHSQSSSRCPRVVIMVPTAELASQVLGNCRSMSKNGIQFQSMVATGGFRQRTQLESLEQGVDVLIVTPGRFMLLVKEGFLSLTNLRCAVLDEVDVLFNDEAFEVALQTLISSSPVSVQYLFITATLPIDVYNKVVELFPDCEAIMGPGIHRVNPGLEEVLVDCSGECGAEKTPETAFLNKKAALLQLVEESPVSKTIIFCNKIETCRKVENTLKRVDRKGTRLRVLPFHAAVAQESRLANMKEFTGSWHEGDSLFLVCTDSEYVRRVGRTARGAGGKGKAFIFVIGKQVRLARKIMERNQKGHPLHDVPSAYELIT
ncbi:DEAD-box ATP-dependent RNA helicase 50 isoform X2 [Carica papaya]|uniref:DEAD-box ATP-dependent RNA helicase 50 isoform X2 n=1 Tax=Carica papaya TaxID=3649 RepID=UPI000B8C7B62|nr:DEAD-box ATP-dependent RNA helicase 50 isoform X2 [Carica papaya]